MDEGWTRLCFENFNFDYHTLMSEEIKKGNLNKKFDVIVLPSDSPEAITGNFKEDRQNYPKDYPEQYRSGIGKEGTEALQEFVKNGGTILAFGDSYQFAKDAFELKIKNIAQDYNSKELFCPGSTLRVNFDNSHPLAFGMPVNGLVLNTSSPVFEVEPGR